MTRSTDKCEHIAWMQCANDHGKFFLHESFRLSKIVQSLPDPDVQTPGVITFYGKRNMQGALRQVFPRNNFRQKNGRSLLNLRIDADSQDSQFPIFFADGDLLNHESTYIRASCHYHKAVPTSWNDGQKPNTPLVLHARLAWLFTNVICIFDEDYGGVERVLDLLKPLIAFSSASSLPLKTRPSLVIVTASRPRSPTMEMLEQEAIHRFKMLQLPDANELNSIPLFGETNLVRLLPHLATLGEILTRYRLHIYYSIGYSHRHFDVAEGHVLLHEKHGDSDICKQVKISELDLNSLNVHSWRIIDGQPHPSEFSEPSSVESDLATNL